MVGISNEQGKRPPIRQKIISFFSDTKNQDRKVLKQEIAAGIGAPEDQISSSMNGILTAPHYSEFAKHVVVVSQGKVWQYNSKLPQEAVKPGLEEPIITPATDEELKLLGHRRETRDTLSTRRLTDGRPVADAIEAALNPQPKLENAGQRMANQKFEALHGTVVTDAKTGVKSIRVFLRSADGRMWVAKMVDY